MKKFFLLFTLLFSACSLVHEQIVPANQFDLTKISQPYTLLSFWATWCEPCKYEIISLDELQPKIEQSVKIVTVAIQEDSAAVKQFVDEHDLGLPVLIDGKELLAKKYDVKEVPVTLLLDQSGQIVPIIDPETANFAPRIDGTRYWNTNIAREYFKNLD